MSLGRDLNTGQQVAGVLYQQAGLVKGKELIPQEFELGGEATKLDLKLAIIICSLQKVYTQPDKIESLFEISSEK